MSYEDVLILKELVSQINDKRPDVADQYSFSFHEFAPGHYDVQICTDQCIYPSEIKRISSAAEEMRLVWFIGGFSSSARFVLQ